MSDPRQDLGYTPAPPAPPSTPRRVLPELLTDQLRTLRRVQRGIALNRSVWTLLSRDELRRMGLIDANPAGGPVQWIVTPLGVEVLEHEKRRR